MKGFPLFAVVPAMLAAFVLAGCAAPASKVRAAVGGNHVGQPISEFLSAMSQKGLFCQRLEKYQSDPRLKAVTDGTLKDVGFYECIASKDRGLCVDNAGIYVLSQYGKVVRIHGKHESKSCLWD